MNRKRLTALFALCAALCLLPALALAEGAADVAIDPTNFPDANFRAYVASFDTDNDDRLSPAELAAVKDMSLIGKSIGDLTGIENFTALTKLDCRGNQLTSLDLSANPKLSFSHCSTNNNTYRLTLDASRTLDLTTLPGRFDVTKASDWSGGTVVGTVLTVDGGAEQVTYSYDCGNGITAYFTLMCGKARYTVTFGNDRAPAQTVTHGEKAVEPPKPTSPGHIFKAWYAGNEPYDFDTPVTQDLHLEDWWKICSHSGSTERSTCTAAAICTVCGGKIHPLKHLWGAWLPDSGAATHTRTCTRGVPHTETEACADNNKDHTCDTCGKVLTVHTGGRATCAAPASCAICGQPYGEKDAAAHAALNHVPARAATTEAEGNIEYWHCTGCDTYYRDAAARNPITLADTVTPRHIPHRYSGPSISVLETSYYDGGNVGLTFISSASFDSFKGVQVDGKTLAAGNYTAGRGSIKVCLKPAYLRTLTSGDHIVTILSTEGDVSAVFAVSAAAGSVTGGKTSPSTFDPGVTAYAAAALVSLTGLTLLPRRKED